MITRRDFIASSVLPAVGVISNDSKDRYDLYIEAAIKFVNVLKITDEEKQLLSEIEESLGIPEQRVRDFRISIIVKTGANRQFAKDILDGKASVSGLPDRCDWSMKR